MRLPRDALLPHCPSAQLTIALKRRFSSALSAPAPCARPQAAAQPACAQRLQMSARAAKKTEPVSLLKYAARYECMGGCVRFCGGEKTRVDMNVSFVYLPKLAGWQPPK